MASVERVPATARKPERWKVRYRHQGANRGKSFITERDARSWANLVDMVGPDRALQILDERPPGQTRTVVEHMLHHVEHLTGITTGTRQRYRNMIEGHFAQHFDGILLPDLTRDHVRAWINAQDGAAPNTIKKRHSLLSSALSSAVEDGLVAANVSSRIRVKGSGRATSEMTFLTAAEYDAIRDELAPQWRPLADFLAGTGCRWSEATALMIRDLDLEAVNPRGRPSPRARIRQSWKYTDGEGFSLGPPKSAKSTRTIAIPASQIPALREVVDGRRRDDFVFVASRGQVVRPWWRYRVWYPAVERALGPDGKRPRLHDLRHTFASWAISGGMPLPLVRDQLGHESIETTVDTYTHVIPSDYERLAATIDEQMMMPALEG